MALAVLGDRSGADRVLGYVQRTESRPAPDPALGHPPPLLIWPFIHILPLAAETAANKEGRVAKRPVASAACFSRVPHT